MDTESGPDCGDPPESAVYVLIALPPGQPEEQVAEEAQQVPDGQQGRVRDVCLSCIPNASPAVPLSYPLTLTY